MIPAFNAASTLNSTLDSVINQTYRPIEVVIVDDGSTDSTSDIIYRFAQRAAVSHDVNVIQIYQDNAGLSAARRVALAHSSGLMLQFLDADDILHPDKFLLCTPFLIASTFDIVVSRTEKFRDSMDIQWCLQMPPKIHPWRETEVTRSTITTNFWHTVGPLFSRHSVERAGGFPINVNPVIDELEFHGRVKLTSPRVFYMHEVLNYYRIGNASSATGSLSKLYRGRIEGVQIAQTLLDDAGDTSNREWYALLRMALQTAYQTAVASSDPVLYNDAWHALLKVLYSRHVLLSAMVAFLPLELSVFVFRAVFVIRRHLRKSTLFGF